MMLSKQGKSEKNQHSSLASKDLGYRLTEQERILKSSIHFAFFLFVSETCDKFRINGRKMDFGWGGMLFCPTIEMCLTLCFRYLLLR